MTPRQMHMGEDTEPDWDDVAKTVRAREWSFSYGYTPRREDVSVPSGSSDPALVERARKYLAKMEASIQGSNGSGALFRAAQVLTRGFELDADSALSVLVEDFSPRCAPPWSVAELRRAVRNAARRGSMVLGSLRDAPKGRAA
jgi:hypothetical protein